MIVTLLDSVLLGLINYQYFISDKLLKAVQVTWNRMLLYETGEKDFILACVGQITVILIR